MKKAIVLILCLSFLVAAFLPVCSAATALAENAAYSDALADLKMDATFSVSQWPAQENTRDLSLITLAESVQKELFVYVYQPAGDKVRYRASHIRLASYIDVESMEYSGVQDYTLTYINNNGVFYKYKVDDMTVSNDAVRYYVVVQLMRQAIPGFDSIDVLDQTVNAVCFNVSRLFCFKVENNETVVESTQIDTIVVTNKYCGFVRRGDSAYGFSGGMDEHFIAFSCDHRIDDLVRIKISFVEQYQHVEHTSGVNYEWQYNEPRELYRTIYSFEESSVSFYDLFGRRLKGTQTWSRIARPADFINSVTGDNSIICEVGSFNVYTYQEISSASISTMLSMDWVVNFYNTSFIGNPALAEWISGNNMSHRTVVSDETILEMQFVTDGVMYNLGVVDNKQTGSSNPINKTKTGVDIGGNDLEDIVATIWKVLAFVGGVILIVLVVRGSYRISRRRSKSNEK